MVDQIGFQGQSFPELTVGALHAHIKNLRHVERSDMPSKRPLPPPPVPARTPATLVGKIIRPLPSIPVESERPLPPIPVDNERPLPPPPVPARTPGTLGGYCPRPLPPLPVQTERPLPPIPTDVAPFKGEAPVAAAPAPKQGFWRSVAQAIRNFVVKLFLGIKQFFEAIFGRKHGKIESIRVGRDVVEFKADSTKQEETCKEKVKAETVTITATDAEMKEVLQIVKEVAKPALEILDVVEDLAEQEEAAAENIVNEASDIPPPPPPPPATKKAKVEMPKTDNEKPLSSDTPPPPPPPPPSQATGKLPTRRWEIVQTEVSEPEPSSATRSIADMVPNSDSAFANHILGRRANMGYSDDDEDDWDDDDSFELQFVNRENQRTEVRVNPEPEAKKVQNQAAAPNVTNVLFDVIARRFNL